MGNNSSLQRMLLDRVLFAIKKIVVNVSSTKYKCL